MRRFSFLLLLSLLSTSAFSDDYHVLESTIGKDKIYMLIEEYESGYINACYFYESSLKNIPLAGEKDSIYTLYFASDVDEFKERFVLTKTPNNIFKGSWEDNTIKQDITLYPVSIDTVKHPFAQLNFVKQLSPFDYIRSSYFSFREEKTSSYKGKEFRWFYEEHSGCSFFRLGNDFSNADVANNTLAGLHISNAIDALSCSFDWSHGGGSMDFSTDISYLTDDLLGFALYASWYCGGPYPDWGTTGFLIDLNNGKSYGIDEIVAFDETVTTEKQSNFTAFSDYRVSYFAPQLMEIINEGEGFKNEGLREDCEYEELWVWNFPDWYFTEQGIMFIPSYPHVSAVCRVDFLVPFSGMKNYKHPQFPYDIFK